MYGAVPPVTVAVNVTAVALVGAAGVNVNSADNASGDIMTVADFVSVADALSVPVTLIVYVPLAL